MKVLPILVWNFNFQFWTKTVAICRLIYSDVSNGTKTIDVSFKYQFKPHMCLFI